MLKNHLPTTFYFSKDGLLQLSKVLKFELSIFQKDVENSYRHLSTFRKTNFSNFQQFFKFELSIFQKDVENSFIDVFQFFEIRTSPIFRKFLNLNFQIFKKMSKTRISMSQLFERRNEEFTNLHHFIRIR